MNNNNNYNCYKREMRIYRTQINNQRKKLQRIELKIKCIMKNKETNLNRSINYKIKYKIQTNNSTGKIKKMRRHQKITINYKSHYR